MRESRIYLNFFKRNLVIIFTPLILGVVFAYFYMVGLPNMYVLTRLYEISYNKSNITAQIALSDEAITEVRSANIQQSIGINSGTGMTIYKPAPLSIYLILQSKNSNLSNDLQKADNYLTNKFPLKKVGIDISTIKKPNYPIYFLEGGIGGFLIGIFISLMQEYFRNY